MLDEPISVHLEVRNLSRSEVKWNATKYGDSADKNTKNEGIGNLVHNDLSGLYWLIIVGTLKRNANMQSFTLIETD